MYAFSFHKNVILSESCLKKFGTSSLKTKLKRNLLPLFASKISPTVMNLFALGALASLLR